MANSIALDSLSWNTGMMGSVSGECPPENFLDIGFEEFLEVAATALNLALNRKYLINAQFIIINDSLQASMEQ